MPTERDIASAGPDQVSLSVVIPTRDRPELLLRTLESLRESAPGAAFEVVVVDDGSDPPLGPTLASLSVPYGLEVVAQPPRGLNAARNAGLARASADIVAFLDDDVRVEPGWASGLVAGFANRPGLAVAAGRVIADPERPIPSWVSRERMMYLSVLDLGPSPVPFPPWASPVGANLAVRREWIQRVGAFADGMDRQGRSLISGGDTELVRRIQSAGGDVAYWPSATVHHHIPAERLTRRWFRRRAEAQGATDIRVHFPHRPSGLDYARELVRPLRAAGIAAKRIAARRDLIDAELWLWSCRGRWRELGRQHKRRAAG